MSLTKRAFEHQTANPMRQTVTRLESAHLRVQSALEAADNAPASFETLEVISRALVAATSDLERVHIDLDALTNQERIRA